MRRRRIALALCAGGAVALGVADWAASQPPGAAVPALTTDLPCYLQHRLVRVSGHGFSAGATYTVKLDGRVLGTGRVGSNGGLTGSLPSGDVAPGKTHARHILTVSDATHTTSSTFYVTVFGAWFVPGSGNPTTLVVRFGAYGFGVGPAQPGDPAHDPRPVPVYLHYVDPLGGEQLTVPLGRTHGVCGSLTRTRQHRLFEFVPGPGRWHLQFDTRASYSPTTAPRVVRAVVVG